MSTLCIHVVFSNAYCPKDPPDRSREPRSSTPLYRCCNVTACWRYCRYFKLLQVLQEQEAAAGGGEGAGAGSMTERSANRQQLALFADCYMAQLMHPEFAAEAVEVGEGFRRKWHCHIICCFVLMPR